MSASEVPRRPPVLVAEPDLDVRIRRGHGRRKASMETNLLRKGVWVPSDQVQLALPLETEDILGHLYITRPLRMFDLDTMAWLVQRWRERRADGATGDTVPFTLYEMGQDFYLRKPAGKERRTLRESLVRLKTTTVTLVGYDAIRRQADEQICGLANFLDALQWRRELNGRAHTYDPRDTGAVRANAFEVKIAGWLIAQLQAENITYLDWRVLRELDGMAKRLWVYLEAQRFSRVQGIGVAQAQIMLGEKAYASLGIHERRPYRVRALLTAAGQKICAVDRSYHQIVVEPSPLNRRVYRVLATRLSKEGRELRDRGQDPLRPFGAPGPVRGQD